MDMEDKRAKTREVKHGFRIGMKESKGELDASTMPSCVSLM